MQSEIRVTVPSGDSYVFPKTDSALPHEFLLPEARQIFAEQCHDDTRAVCAGLAAATLVARLEDSLDRRHLRPVRSRITGAEQRRARRAVSYARKNASVEDFAADACGLLLDRLACAFMLGGAFSGRSKQSSLEFFSIWWAALGVEYQRLLQRGVTTTEIADAVAWEALRCSWPGE